MHLKVYWFSKLGSFVLLYLCTNIWAFVFQILCIKAQYYCNFISWYNFWSMGYRALRDMWTLATESDIHRIYSFWGTGHFKRRVRSIHKNTRKEFSPLATNPKMKDVNMCQQLYITHHNEMHPSLKHPPMLFTVNEISIEHLRDYHAEARAIPNAFISGIKLEFISH